MKARWGTLLIAAVLILGSTPAGASAPKYRVGIERGDRTYEVYRTSDAPRRLRMTIKLDNPKYETSTIQSEALVRRGAGWDVMQNFGFGFAGYAEVGNGAAWHRIYGSYRSPDCPHDVLCQSTIPTGNLSFPIDSQRAERFTFFFQLTDVTGTVTIDSPGFRLRETRKTKFRRVLGEDVSTGVYGVRESWEHFTEASLPGGRYGSVTHALIPCEDAGTGRAKLSGGLDNWEDGGWSQTDLYCGTHPGAVSPFAGGEWGGWDIAYKATTWRLKGDVIGASRARFRLAVFDFPKP